MCRFTAYIGNNILLADLVTRPSRSIIRQSFDCHERGLGLSGDGSLATKSSAPYLAYNLNGDGFGIGWYAPKALKKTVADLNMDTPCVFASLKPAWNDRNLERLAQKIVSPLVFAHVRAAGPGTPVNEEACHPFSCGRYLFMHNGGIGGLRRIQRELVSRMDDLGFDWFMSSTNTDSAIAFALFLSQLDNDPFRRLTPDELRIALDTVVSIICHTSDEAEVDDMSLLNFVVSDGTSVVATRFVRAPKHRDPLPCSLYYSFGTRFECHEDVTTTGGSKEESSADAVDAHVTDDQSTAAAVAVGEPPLSPATSRPSTSRPSKEQANKVGEGGRTATYGMTREDRRTEVVIVASEPLTDDRGDWLPVPSQHTVVITSDLHILVAPCCLHSDAHHQDSPSLKLSRSFLQLDTQTRGSPSPTPTTPSPPQTPPPPPPATFADDDLLQFVDVAAPSQPIDDRRERHSRRMTESLNTLHYVQQQAGEPASPTTPIGCHRGLSASAGGHSPCGAGSSKDGAVPGSPHSSLDDDEARHWSTAKDRPEGRITAPTPHVMTGHMDTVLCLELSSDGALLYSGGQDGQLRAWDTKLRCCEASVVGAHDAIMALHVTSERSETAGGGRHIVVARLVTAGADTRLKVWRARYSYSDGGAAGAKSLCNETVVELTCLRCMSLGAGGNVLCIATAAVAPDETPCIFYGLQNTHIMAEAVSTSDSGSAAATEADGGGINAFCGTSSAVHVSCTENRHFGFCYTLAVCNGRVCSGGGDAFIKIWDTEGILRQRAAAGDEEEEEEEESNEWRCVATLSGHRSAVLALASLCNEQLKELASGSGDCRIKLWDLDQFVCRRTLTGHRASVQCLAATANFLISGSSDGEVVVWNRMRNYEKTRLLASEGTNSSLAQRRGFTLSEGMNTGLAQRKKHHGRLSARQHGCAKDHPPEDPAQYHRRRALNVQALRISEPQGGVFTVFTGSADAAIRTWDIDCKDSPSSSDGGDSNLVNISPYLSAYSAVPSLSAPVVGGGDGGRTREEGEDKEEGSALSSCNTAARHARGIEHILRAFVAFKSVSVDANLHEHCWRCAKFLSAVLESMLSAEVRLVNEGGVHLNPVVLARVGAPFNESNPTVVIYGHYDVMPAGDLHAWQTDPWRLTGANGYLYGRGATDDKGPIVATVFALKELLEEGALKRVNVVLIYEGEEEASSEGLQTTIERHRHWIDPAGGGVSAIIVSNNYWVGENLPCLTYAMRGIIVLRVIAEGPKDDLHSGVDGGAIVEPLSDLIAILACLTSQTDQRVAIPGFNDGVRQLDDAEAAFLTAIERDEPFCNADKYVDQLGVRSAAKTTRELLERRWRLPALSVTSVRTSHSEAWTSIIPRRAEGDVSIRFVPDQSADVLIGLFTEFVQAKFAERRSPNSLRVEVTKVGDYWMGDYRNRLFHAASEAIEEQWGCKPLFVREGGTNPITRFLETTLEAPAIHIPLGQRSDAAHLPNERIRQHNLIKGKNVLKRVLQAV